MKSRSCSFLMKFNNFTITICFLFFPYLTERQDTSFSQAIPPPQQCCKNTHAHKQSTVHTTDCVCHIPLALFQKQFLASKKCTGWLNQMKKSGYDWFL
jgi:hypothetical protein